MAQGTQKKEGDDEATDRLIYATWAVGSLLEQSTGIYVSKLAAKPVQVTQRRDASVQIRAIPDRGTETRRVETMSPVTYRRNIDGSVDL